MSVRKAHNSGRNHERNVLDYYQKIGHEKAQSVIDSITSSYAAEGQPGANPMLAPQGGGGPMGGQPFPPPPFGFPGGLPPPPFGLPGGPNGAPAGFIPRKSSPSTTFACLRNYQLIYSSSSTAPIPGRGMPFPPFPPPGGPSPGGQMPGLPAGMPFPPPEFRMPPQGFPPPPVPPPQQPQQQQGQQSAMSPPQPGVPFPPPGGAGMGGPGFGGGVGAGGERR
ncbi:hypothetical protein MMC22_007653 [Lobaria immixta]|nr:hypothetical protein [Lobaria immixta]